MAMTALRKASVVCTLMVHWRYSTVPREGLAAYVTSLASRTVSRGAREPLKLSYFLHKHQMKATKNSQAYTVGTHGCV